MTAQSLRQRALNLLARREHSRTELFRKLTSNDFADTDVNNLLDQLQKEKLLSDERFTEAYIAMRRQRGYGPLRIQQELQERGVSTQIISQFLIPDNEAWLNSALQVREKKFSAELPDDFPARAKQMNFLQYRGFTQQQIQTTLKATLQESSS